MVQWLRGVSAAPPSQRQLHLITRPCWRVFFGHCSLECRCRDIVTGRMGLLMRRRADIVNIAELRTIKKFHIAITMQN
jgi:hypothetical protein